jgi:hypothetical protein
MLFKQLNHGFYFAISDELVGLIEQDRAAALARCNAEIFVTRGPGSSTVTLSGFGTTVKAYHTGEFYSVADMIHAVPGIDTVVIDSPLQGEIGINGLVPGFTIYVVIDNQNRFSITGYEADAEEQQKDYPKVFTPEGPFSVMFQRPGNGWEHLFANSMEMVQTILMQEFVPGLKFRVFALEPEPTPIKICMSTNGSGETVWSVSE